LKTPSKIVLLLIAMGLLMGSCMKKETYPIIPHIEFAGFTKLVHPLGFDTLGILRITYTDGDGDLGISQFDTTAYNFFVAYYVMKDGALVPGTVYNNISGKFDTINFNNRFGPLTPDDYSGWIKGEIEDTIKPLYDPRSTAAFDTIQFRVHMVDRAGHHSDTVITPLIVVRNP